MLSYDQFIILKYRKGGTSGPYNVMISSGIKDVSLDVLVNDDELVERNESFYLIVNLASVSRNIIVGVVEAIVTIVDNDGKGHRPCCEYTVPVRFSIVQIQRYMHTHCLAMSQ